MRGGRRGGLWSEWAGTLLSAGGGTILNVVLDIGMSPLRMSPVSGTGRERAHGRERSLRGPLREPGSPLSASGSRSLAQGHPAVDADGSGGGSRAIMLPLRNETGEGDVPRSEDHTS